MLFYTYKILREITKVFGRNNILYKTFKRLVDKEANKNLKYKYSNKALLIKIADTNAYFAAYILFKQHYGIEIPAECVGVGNKFEYVRIKLKDIRRQWTDGRIHTLKQIEPYRYLQTGDKKIYEKYLKKAIEVGMFPKDTVRDVKAFDDLFKSVKKHGYDPTKSVICINSENILLDGQHRACCLLYLYGEDYEINVVKVSRI
jgi:hypothetical protein